VVTGNGASVIRCKMQHYVIVAQPNGLQLYWLSSGNVWAVVRGHGGVDASAISRSVFALLPSMLRSINSALPGAHMACFGGAGITRYMWFGCAASCEAVMQRYFLACARGHAQALHPSQWQGVPAEAKPITKPQAMLTVG